MNSYLDEMKILQRRGQDLADEDARLHLEIGHLETENERLRNSHEAMTLALANSRQESERMRAAMEKISSEWNGACMGAPDQCNRLAEHMVKIARAALRVSDGSPSGSRSEGA